MRASRAAAGAARRVVAGKGQAPPPERRGEGGQVAPSPSPSPSPSCWWWLVVGVYRVANALALGTAFVPDEYWQALEVAHYAVFGYPLCSPNRWWWWWCMSDAWTRVVCGVCVCGPGMVT
jgi:hypothetical protein